MKKILLVSFKFPPYSRTGSFRWTKLSRAFAGKGYKVHVVTLDWNIGDRTDYSEDVNHENIIIHRIPSAFPHNFFYKKYGASLIGKIKNKLRNQIQKLLKWTYFVDDAQKWGKYLLPFCRKLVNEENIQTIIATGAPFMQNYWAARLKTEIESESGGPVRLIQDFRDEWNEGRGFYVAGHRKKSLDFEKYAVNNCDAVVTVSRGLMELFSASISNQQVKKAVIYNGFDEQKIKETGETMGRDFRFLYAGNLDNGRDALLFEFLKTVQNHTADFPEIKIILYTNSTDKLDGKFPALREKGILQVNSFIPQEQLYPEINKAFVTLHFMPPAQWFIVSIKIFEYAILNRPVFSINGGGDVEQLIKEHKLGTSLNFSKEKEKILEKIQDYYTIWKKDPFYEIEPENIERYSFENISGEYISLIESLT